MTELTKAATDVLAERRRQIEVEGFTPKRDDTYREGQLADAAASYACRAWWHDYHNRTPPITDIWPWEFTWWKPKNRRADLVRAAALLLAEIERLDRRA
jgi:hypothetical protein